MLFDRCAAARERKPSQKCDETIGISYGAMYDILSDRNKPNWSLSSVQLHLRSVLSELIWTELCQSSSVYFSCVARTILSKRTPSSVHYCHIAPASNIRHHCYHIISYHIKNLLVPPLRSKRPWVHYIHTMQYKTVMARHIQYTNSAQVAQHTTLL